MGYYQGYLIIILGGGGLLSELLIMWRVSTAVECVDTATKGNRDMLPM